MKKSSDAKEDKYKKEKDAHIQKYKEFTEDKYKKEKEAQIQKYKGLHTAFEEYKRQYPSEEKPKQPVITLEEIPTPSGTSQDTEEENDEIDEKSDTTDWLMIGAVGLILLNAGIQIYNVATGRIPVTPSPSLQTPRQSFSQIWNCKYSKDGKTGVGFGAGIGYLLPAFMQPYVDASKKPRFHNHSFKPGRHRNSHPCRQPFLVLPVQDHTP